MHFTTDRDRSVIGVEAIFGFAFDEQGLQTLSVVLGPFCKPSAKF
jgi:hypothetical protein